jgi:hypothetical protein
MVIDGADPPPRFVIEVPEEQHVTASERGELFGELVHWCPIVPRGHDVIVLLERRQRERLAARDRERSVSMR